MIEFKAPENYKVNNKIFTIFLAGSIEMGKAEHWQEKLVNYFFEDNVIFLNPRRKDWDNTWEQISSNKNFNQQVNWELEALCDSNLVVFYFDPNTQSPITLLELGYMLGKNKHLIVCVPDGYFRKGNIEITCQKEGINILHNFDELVLNLHKIIKKEQNG